MYQARLALLEALRYAYRDSGIEIAVEKLDDVPFEKDGGALDLLQTKHHLNISGAGARRKPYDDPETLGSHAGVNEL